MTAIGHPVRRQLVAVSQGWQSFWFQPQPMYTLGLVRIAFGALIVVWALWLLPMRNGLLDADGVTPTQPRIEYTWGLFQRWNGNAVMLVAIITPMVLVAWCSVERSFLTGPSSVRTPSEIRNASPNTIVECPSENQNPTLKGRLPSFISFRVVLSIAEM